MVFARREEWYTESEMNQLNQKRNNQNLSTISHSSSQSSSSSSSSYFPSLKKMNSKKLTLFLLFAIITLFCCTAVYADSAPPSRRQSSGELGSMPGRKSGKGKSSPSTSSTTQAESTPPPPPPPPSPKKTKPSPSTSSSTPTKSSRSSPSSTSPATVTSSRKTAGSSGKADASKVQVKGGLPKSSSHKKTPSSSSSSSSSTPATTSSKKQSTTSTVKPTTTSKKQSHSSSTTPKTSKDTATQAKPSAANAVKAASKAAVVEKPNAVKAASKAAVVEKPASSSPASPCGQCNHGICVTDAATKKSSCQCFTGYFGSSCQYGPGGGGVCVSSASAAAALSPAQLQALSKNPNFVEWKQEKNTNIPTKPCGVGGNCTDSQCVCGNGYTGSFCQLAPCPKSCSFNGFCSHPAPDFAPVCTCLYGTSGPDCSVDACQGCSGHGKCLALTAVGNFTGSDLVCECQIGYSGKKCETKVCPKCQHGKCDNSTKTCQCDAGFTGPDCSIRVCPNKCNGRGICNTATGFCSCDEGWSGDDCSLDLSKCPNKCSGNGVCTPSGCKCQPLAIGLDCSTLLCPNNCNNHGQCVNGQCVCDPAYTGTDCSAFSCPNNCNGNGVCKNGACYCLPPYTGVGCEVKSCPNQCSGHGTCVNGQCQCYNQTQIEDIFRQAPLEHPFGFTGEDCSQLRCATSCGAERGRGYCNTTLGECVCKDGFWGPDGKNCDSTLCSDPCNGRGFCVDGGCVCDHAPNKLSGWTGDHCELEICPHHCYENVGLGKCVNGECQCREGWYGRDCSEKECPKDYSPLAGLYANKTMCAGHGLCNNGTCECHQGYGGEACNVRQCPNNCAGHGTCLATGKCACDAKHKGADCSELVCDTDCGESKGNGYCDGNKGKCVCKAGNFGADCSYTSCDASCNGHGFCPGGQNCACDPGYTGIFCEYQYCPHNCSASLKQGECIDGKTCKCKPGFSGIDCSYSLCPVVEPPAAAASFVATMKAQECAGLGYCAEGECKCRDGWKGSDCTIRACQFDCSLVGQCDINGVCHCPSGDIEGRGGYAGKFCETPICPKNCSESSGQGKCISGLCVCENGFWGPDCTYKACPTASSPLSGPEAAPVMCGGRGDCGRDGVCQCHKGFTGPDCTRRTCPNDCNHNGMCDSSTGTCTCDDRHTGDSCQTLSCPKGCSGHGKCQANGQCKCDSLWTGAQCQVVKCPSGCSGNGECRRTAEVVDKNGTVVVQASEQCVCDLGFSGADCSKVICDPVDCNGKGRCVVSMEGLHVCRCDAPYTGKDCGNKLCTKTCSFHGTCVNNKCECDAGWYGEDCDRVEECPADCMGRGKCVAGLKGKAICQCQAPWGGEACDQCVSDCSGNGKCTEKGCQCSGKWQGANCDVAGVCKPSANCNGRGECVADVNNKPVCQCKAPFSGPGCEKCDLDCGAHGSCDLSNGKCKCNDGWQGDKCDRKGSCPNNCNGQGNCLGDKDGNPFCQCIGPYGGPDCSQLKCDKTCEGNSECLNGQCVCKTGWTGAKCDEKVGCPGNGNCNGHGVCVADAKGSPVCRCDAQSGFGGIACNEPLCNRTCSNHGSCLNNKCQCNQGWKGDNCEQLDCSFLGNCNGNGECGLDVSGNPVCICDEKFAGKDCKDIRCSLYCKHGECINNQCTCEKGWKGKACDYTIDCPDPTCGKGNGQCVGDPTGSGKGVCKCEEGFTGPTCTDVLCADKCSGNGTCINEVCQCKKGYHGAKCDVFASCPNDCNGSGECLWDEVERVSFCKCNSLADGQSCEIKRGVGWLDQFNDFQYRCIEPYYGVNCTSKKCPGECVHGTCNNKGVCECKSGFTGKLCNEFVCPNGCSGGGDCDVKTGMCRCHYGYTGDDCSTFTEQVCISTCLFKCQAAGSAGLIQVKDEKGQIQYVSSARCAELCQTGKCNELFGSTTARTTDGVVTITSSQIQQAQASQSSSSSASSSSSSSTSAPSFRVTKSTISTPSAEELLAQARERALERYLQKEKNGFNFRQKAADTRPLASLKKSTNKK